MSSLNVPSFSLKPLSLVLFLYPLVESLSVFLISPLYTLKGHNNEFLRTFSSPGYTTPSVSARSLSTDYGLLVTYL